MREMDEFETMLKVRPISEIKEELARLKEVMDNEEYGTDEYYRAVSRYWGIRWVLKWEREIPE
jgi:hypothetical protein